MSIRAVQCEKKTKHDMHSWEKDKQEVFCLGVEVAGHIPIRAAEKMKQSRALAEEMAQDVAKIPDHVKERYT